MFEQRDEALDRAFRAGVRTALLVNSEFTEQSLERTMRCLCAQSQVRKYAAFGVHPHHASDYNDRAESRLRELLAMKDVVALGEVGLDFYYDYSPRDAQKNALLKQIRLAMELSLPVVIHCRDAYGELATILKSEAPQWRGMIHCFTGVWNEAASLLELGFHISFSGIVTFRNADAIRDAAKQVPDDRVLVETDAPFLTPVPHRGKTNEPSFVVHTGAFVARLRGTPVDEFSELTSRNFDLLFRSES